MPRISSEHWQRVQRTLDTALALEPRAVSAYLDEACSDDETVRREVERMLAACAEADHFLESPPSRLAAELLAELPVLEGRRIGPYVITSRIGRGGMGVVYLAERDDGQFRQRVALKLVPRGLETEHALRRFLDERQILASLNHPGIARLLDGGITTDGVPYFAMEYVEGTPIDRYCAERALDIDSRLELFALVCDAVQYAHQNLVVHRDIKPSNILVTDPDAAHDAGRPKLLDFGIAKLLDESGPRDSTGTGARWLTPRYASPEQILGAPVTTMSDGYALGVLLYELLTGVSPYPREADTPSALEQAVCETDPPRPSSAVSDPRVARRLRGDLDTIVLTAMQKEPSRRYASAGALAEDIRRHLTGKPVRARPDTLRYRAAKWVRRHRVGAVVAVALILSLIVGILGTAWQASIASRERDRARQQAATAARASELLVEMFRLSDPDVTRGATITAREVLDRGARHVEQDFASDPPLQAALLAELGKIYQNLGLFDDAYRLVSRATDVWRAGGPSVELATGLHRLGELERARARSAPAVARLREALAMRRAQVPVPLADVAVTTRELARALADQGQDEDAERTFRDALALMREAHGPRSPEVAATLFSFAASYHNRSDLKSAEPLFRQAIDIYRETPNTRDPEAATARINLATVLLFKERYAEAEPLLREGLAQRRAIYGNAHPATIEAMTALGTLLHNTSQFREADTLLSELHSVATTRLGPHHVDVLTAKQLLGATYTDEGKFDDAERMYREAIAGWRGVEKNGEGPHGVYAQLFLAENNLSRGALDAAERGFGEVASVSARIFGPTHPYVALGERGLGRVELKRGRATAAEMHLRRALTILEGKMRPNHRYLLAVQRALGEALAARGQREAADSLLRAVLALERAALPPQHADLARTLQAYGALKLSMGDAKGAEPLLREALAIRKARLLPGQWQIAESEELLKRSMSVSTEH
jgi:serine/threonine-protein kinase